MRMPACDGFRAELERALERGEAGALPELVGHAHLVACDACRARLDEELALDALLAIEPGAGPPVGLAARLQTRLTRLMHEHGDVRLDELLGRVPAPVPPRDLARRVLAALVAERTPAARPRRIGLALAAALLLLVAGAWLFGRSRSAPRPPELAHGLMEAGEPEAELLEALDALENWELVTSDDLELVLAGLDPLDTSVLELGAEPELGEDPQLGDEIGG
jgi:hypothetical protein